MTTLAAEEPGQPFYSMPPNWNPDGQNWVDYGLGGYLKSAGFAPEVYEPELGKVKVPTLRNVDLRPSEDFVKAYGPTVLQIPGRHRLLLPLACRDGCRHGGGGMASMFPPRKWIRTVQRLIFSRVHWRRTSCSS